MALTIATGFVVDDAIVVVENIIRHHRRGDPPSLAGPRPSAPAKIGFTVLSISVSLVAVFIPILLMSGIIGRLFHEFAITLSVAIRDLARRLADDDADDVRPPPRSPVPTRQARRDSSGSSEKIFDWHSAGSRRTAPGRALRHQWATLLITVGTVALTCVPLRHRPQGVLPAAGHRPAPGEHRRRPGHFVSGDVGSSLVRSIRQRVREDPAVSGVVGFHRRLARTDGSNSGRMFVTLKPLRERQRAPMRS